MQLRGRSFRRRGKLAREDRGEFEVQTEIPGDFGGHGGDLGMQVVGRVSRVVVRWWWWGVGRRRGSCRGVGGVFWGESVMGLGDADVPFRWQARMVAREARSVR